MKENRFLHLIMLATLSVAGVIGVFELVTALFVSTINVVQLTAWLHALTQQELLQSPHSIILLYIAHSIPPPTLSASLKLITLVWLTIHGLTNIALAFAVLTKRFWIYPLAITSFTLLTLYQVYMWLHHPNATLAFFVIIGFLVVVLTWREYQHRRRSA